MDSDNDGRKSSSSGPGSDDLSDLEKRKRRAYNIRINELFLSNKGIPLYKKKKSSSSSRPGSGDLIDNEKIREDCIRRNELFLNALIDNEKIPRISSGSSSGDVQRRFSFVSLFLYSVSLSVSVFISVSVSSSVTVSIFHDIDAISFSFSLLFLFVQPRF